jgi:hypothetical protein
MAKPTATQKLVKYLSENLSRKNKKSGNSITEIFKDYCSEERASQNGKLAAVLGQGHDIVPLSHNHTSHASHTPHSPIQQLSHCPIIWEKKTAIFQWQI